MVPDFGRRTSPPLLHGIPAGLMEGVTDHGLHALVSAGCGEKLTSLDLQCEYFFLLLGFSDVAMDGQRKCCTHKCTHSLLFSLGRFAGLENGVTDGGLRALASSGCGKNLTSLYFRGACFSFGSGERASVSCVVKR